MALILVCVFVAACGAGSHGHIDDAGFDASVDAAADAGFDASSFGRTCSRDDDCASSPGFVCEPNGMCGPRYCAIGAEHMCPGALWCVYGRCALPSCEVCPDGTLCQLATGECVAPADPVACRASGGLYVRGRCMRSGEGETVCDGGFGAEIIPGVCGVPEAFAQVAFPVARVDDPVTGSLATLGLLGDLWSFAYVDGATAMTAGIDAHSVVDARAYGCVQPLAGQPTRLCEQLSSESAFACGGLDPVSIAAPPLFSGESMLVLAARDGEGRLHVELLRLGGGHYTPRAEYTSSVPSRVWSPISVPFGLLDVVWFREGLAPPLTLVRMNPFRAAERWPEAGLAAGEEFGAWSEVRAVGRSESGALRALHAASRSPRIEAQTLLSAAQAPVGRYLVTGSDDAASLTAHSSSPLPSTLLTFALTASASGTVSVERVHDRPSVGLTSGAAVAVAMPDGSYVIQGQRSTPLIARDDVGGEIVAVRDLTQTVVGCSGLETSGGALILVAAMLDIRLADGRQVRELWAGAIGSR